MAEINIFDRTLKIIARDHADVFLKLAFPGEKIKLVGTLENVELSLPEERVDFVHELEYNGEEYLLHLEFQLQHKRNFPKKVFIYSAELTDQFDKSVISLVLYLQQRESPIPESYTVPLGNNVINRFSYPVLKLWDYEKEIRSGEFRELAPLLSIIVEEPTVETLEEERQLILQEKDAKKRARLFATAVTIASRYFERDFLWKFFREEMKQMREVPFISDWIKEGWQEGWQKGYAQACREDIISLLEDKFGVVKGNILKSLDRVERVESLRMLLKRIPKVETQEEFLDLVKIAVGE
ncbi:MAG: hypothetical protein ACE5PV_05350 [Candidatus Poribacteria bacterium]